ncbi:MmpS family transport accessory protein [Nocardia sp. NPDC059228]|uniref:MmpS family transport accessory protein n=1 Tax=Nocardia sp. NPDC059228 TaxID=3346777 RepID=UPI0036B3FF65
MRALRTSVVTAIVTAGAAFVMPNAHAYAYAGHRVTYEAWSATGIAWVTYYDSDNNLTDFITVPTPWKLTLINDSVDPLYSMTVTNTYDDDSHKVSCRLTIDGVVTSTHTATGNEPMADCDG